MITPGDDARPRGRAQRRRVHIRIQQATSGQRIQVRRRDRAAITAQLPKTGVIQHDYQHVRGPGRGHAGLDSSAVRPITPGNAIPGSYSSSMSKPGPPLTMVSRVTLSADLPFGSAEPPEKTGRRFPWPAVNTCRPPLRCCLARIKARRISSSGRGHRVLRSIHVPSLRRPAAGRRSAHQEE
jgi:hypothetical protein